MTHAIPDDATPAQAAASILAAIRAEPHRHDQEVWAYGPVNRALHVENGGKPYPIPDADMCGTVMCVAGWASHLNGWRMHWGSGRVTRDGQASAAPIRAAQLLGLREGAAEALFEATKWQAIRALELIAGGTDPDRAVDQTCGSCSCADCET